MKIIVLAGGLSPERDVSLTSGLGICKTLRERGHQAFLLDVFFGLPYDSEKLEEARLLMNQYGYFPVENDMISQVHMENAIGVLNAYLRKMPKRLCDEFRKK